MNTDLQPLPPRSDQELFDAALHGIRKQGCVSTGDSGGCAYRGEPTDCGVVPKCGVGHLIPDNVIAALPNFEGAWVSFEPSKYVEKSVALHQALKLSGIQSSQLRLLMGLQAAHDDVSNLTEPWAKFESNMREVAMHYGLTYTEPSA